VPVTREGLNPGTCYKKGGKERISQPLGGRGRVVMGADPVLGGC